jgi:hypothetical protein
MWHSCGRFSLEALFARSAPHVLPLFKRFATLVRANGRVTVVPQKTRVVFMDRVRFAGAMPRRDHFVAHFILGRRIVDARIARYELLPPAYHVHYVRIASVADFDGKLRGWLDESYRGFGRQGYRGLRVVPPKPD